MDAIIFDNVYCFIKIQDFYLFIIFDLIKLFTDYYISRIKRILHDYMCFFIEKQNFLILNQDHNILVIYFVKF